MSARKFRLTFSAPAQRDVDNILAYTLEHWGERQVGIYKRKLDTAFSTLTEDPLRGREREDGIRMFLAERHRIFCRINKDRVYVIRILHERMDEVRHL